MSQLKDRFANSVQDFRIRLAHPEAVLQLASLGVFAGVLASLLIVAFGWLSEAPITYLLGLENEGFEALSTPARFLLPFVGALLIGTIIHFTGEQSRVVGVPHVVERLHNNHGKLPGKNLVMQFITGILALLSGQSVGREGPAIHLGAGVASLMGQYFHLPNNSLRTLVACGCAAGISATFNTPMAGVVFAMEVVLMEYTIVGFIPVIIASVLGATISQLAFHSDFNFELASENADVLSQLPFLVLFGFIFSLAAAAFIRLNLFAFQFQRHNVILRFALIGTATGIAGVFLPQLLGTGYDTLESVIRNQLSVQLLVVIFLAKLLLTASVTGLGVTGGLIGPILVIGGCLGGTLGIIGNQLSPLAAEPEFFVVLGMVSMMGAVLNAPLAAMIAILELSNNPDIVFPGMLCVVVASLGVKQMFNYDGVFAEQLKRQGHTFFTDTGRGFMSRVGVRSMMNRSYLECGAVLNQAEAQEALDRKVLWLVVETEDNPVLLPSTALADWLKAQQEAQVASESDEDNSDAGEDQSDSTAVDPAGPESEPVSSGETVEAEPATIELTTQAEILNTATIDSLASLHEANQVLRDRKLDALVVVDNNWGVRPVVVGVITRGTIEAYFGF